MQKIGRKIAIVVGVTLSLPLAQSVGPLSTVAAACSIGTTELADGATGPEVLCLDITLHDAGFGPEVPDENFDVTTVDAVEAFQLANQLQVTGVVDESTGTVLGIWSPPPASNAPTSEVEEITDPEVAEPGLAPIDTPATTTPTSTATPTTATPTTATPTSTSTSTTVVPVAPTVAPPTTTTTSATTTTTTVVPSSTRVAPTATTTPSPNGCTITRTLSIGMNDCQVLRLENELAARGYNPGTKDGRYDNNTANAVRKAETAGGFYVDGIANPGFVTKFLANKPGSSPKPVAQPTANGCTITRTLSIGMNDCQVLRLENELAARGYNPGTKDGRYDNNTANAVRKAEAAGGFYVDGIANPGFVTKFLANKPGSSPKPVPTRPASGALGCSRYSSGRYAMVDRIAQRYLLCNGGTAFGGQRRLTAGPINDAPKGVYSVFFQRQVWFGGRYRLNNFTAFTRGDRGGRVGFHQFVIMPESGLGTERYRNASGGCFRVSASDALATRNFLTLGSKVVVLNNG